MFRVNNRSSRTTCEICAKLTIKTPERRLRPATLLKKRLCEKGVLRNFAKSTGKLLWILQNF